MSINIIQKKHLARFFCKIFIAVKTIILITNITICNRNKLDNPFYIDYINRQNCDFFTC